MGLLLTDNDAVKFASTLVLDHSGLPPADADEAGLMSLTQFPTVNLGSGAWSITRHLQWSAKKAREVSNLASQSGFGKIVCPITETEFEKYAPSTINATVHGVRLNCIKKVGAKKINPKTGKPSGGAFKGGKFGYWLGGKVAVEINGKTVFFQPTINMVAIGQNVAGSDIETGEDEEA